MKKALIKTLVIVFSVILPSFVFAGEKANDTTKKENASGPEIFSTAFPGEGGGKGGVMASQMPGKDIISEKMPRELILSLDDFVDFSAKLTKKKNRKTKAVEYFVKNPGDKKKYKIGVFANDTTDADETLAKLKKKVGKKIHITGFIIGDTILGEIK